MFGGIEDPLILWVFTALKNPQNLCFAKNNFQRSSVQSKYQVRGEFKKEENTMKDFGSEEK